MRQEIPEAATGTTFHAVSLLWPITSLWNKRRFGRNRDGGYVMITPSKTELLVSFGVGDDLSFETDISPYVSSMKIFDDMASADRVANLTPGLPQNATYTQASIGTGPGQVTVADAVGDLGSYDRVIIQMDIEGQEFDAISATSCPSSLLKENVSQFVFEVHKLTHLSDPAYRAKFIMMMEHLTNHMSVLHVHSNNSDGQWLSVVDGLIVSDYLEITLVSDRLLPQGYSEWSTGQTWPLEADRPNCGGIDKPMWYYPFMPNQPPLLDMFNAWRSYVRRDI